MASQPGQRALLHTPTGTDPADPWVTSNGVGYDADKVYSRASDGRGHSELIHVKISPALDAVIREAIEKVPEYKTKSDVVRDALIHRLHAVALWPDTHLNLQPLQWEMAQQSIDRMVANQQAWDELIKSADSLLNALITAGDYETAEHQLELLESLQDMTPPYIMKMGAMCHQHRLRIAHYKPEDTGNHD